MLIASVVPTQYIVIISTVRRQSDFDGRKLVSSVGSMLVRLLISAWDIIYMTRPEKRNLSVQKLFSGL